MIQIRLPWPPTGNHAYTVARGRKILSSAGRAYRDLAVTMARLQRAGRVAVGRLAVHIVAHVPDRRRRDIDNLIKLPMDCVTLADVMQDDSQIDDLRITRALVSSDPGLVITITEIQG